MSKDYDWAKYKRERRKQLKSDGFPLRQLHVHEADWPRVKAFADRLREGRQKKIT